MRVIKCLSAGLRQENVSKWRMCRPHSAVFLAIFVAASSSAVDLQAGNVTGL